MYAIRIKHHEQAEPFWIPWTEVNGVKASPSALLVSVRDRQSCWWHVCDYIDEADLFSVLGWRSAPAAPSLQHSETP